ncbi:MAG: flavin reductase family protein, partial [Gemmatimonadales bacterium]
MDPSQFRQLLGRFATGVAVLTVTTPQGHPLGMTANSVSSVSLYPPLLSVCVDREAEMHDAILQARQFVVNILSSP